MSKLTKEMSAKVTFKVTASYTCPHCKEDIVKEVPDKVRAFFCKCGTMIWVDPGK